MKWVLFFSLFFLLLFTPASVKAHGLGLSFEEVVGPYLIDIGYEPETFVEDETITLGFLLLEAETRDPVEFKDVWVRITKDDSTIFATGINSGFAFSPTMLFTFPDAGDYTLNVRYSSEEDTLAETEIPLVVEKKEERLNPLALIFPSLALLVGCVAGFFAAKMRRSHSSKKRDQEEK